MQSISFKNSLKFQNSLLSFEIFPCLIGLIIFTFGAWFAYLKTDEVSYINLFGTDFSSTKIGVIITLIGAFILILSISYFLKSINKIEENNYKIEMKKFE